MFTVKKKKFEAIMFYVRFLKKIQVEIFINIIVHSGDSTEKKKKKYLNIFLPPFSLERFWVFFRVHNSLNCIHIFPGAQRKSMSKLEEIKVDVSCHHQKLKPVLAFGT